MAGSIGSMAGGTGSKTGGTGSKTGGSASGRKLSAAQPYSEPSNYDYAMAADPIVKKMTPEQIRKAIENSTEKMKEAAKNLDFLLAAQYRDEVVELQRLLDEK